MVPYVMAMTHLQFLEQILVGKQPIRYNRNDNKFFIDMDWGRLAPGAMLIVECYGVLDPATNPKIWSNIWLQKYAVALIKFNYAENLSKFNGVQMPGGVTFNGQTLKEEAKRDMEAIERDIIHSYSIPVTDMIG